MRYVEAASFFTVAPPLIVSSQAKLNSSRSVLFRSVRNTRQQPRSRMNEGKKKDRESSGTKGASSLSLTAHRRSTSAVSLLDYQEQSTFHLILSFPARERQRRSRSTFSYIALCIYTYTARGREGRIIRSRQRQIQRGVHTLRFI